MKNWFLRKGVPVALAAGLLAMGALSFLLSSRLYQRTEF